MAPPHARSVALMREQRTVLASQDGSNLNFARRPHTQELQIIGMNQNGARTPGRHLHATLAANDRFNQMWIRSISSSEISS